MVYHPLYVLLWILYARVLELVYLLESVWFGGVQPHVAKVKMHKYAGVWLRAAARDRAVAGGRTTSKHAEHLS